MNFKKIIRKLGSIIVAIMLVFTTSNQAFALDSSENYYSTKDAEVVSDLIDTNSYVDLYPKLGFHLSSSKEIVIFSTSESRSGGLFLYLYAPNGEEDKLVSHDWSMGVNEIAVWEVNNPPWGTWRLRIVAMGNSEPVMVFVNWR